MVNDEVNNKVINIEIKVAQYSAKPILKGMKKIKKMQLKEAIYLQSILLKKGKLIQESLRIL